MSGDEVYGDDVTSGVDLSYRNPFRDELATRLYGWTPNEARKARQCVRCRNAVNLIGLSAVDQSEYWISTLCPSCFAEVTE